MTSFEHTAHSPLYNRPFCSIGFAVAHGPGLLYDYYEYTPSADGSGQAGSEKRHETCGFYFVEFKPDGARIREISCPAIGSVSRISGNWDSNDAFFIFASFHIPTTIYRYDIEKGIQVGQ